MKFPSKLPILPIEIINENSFWLNGPVGNVLFSLVSSSRFIVAQKFDKPNVNVKILPKRIKTQ